MITGTPMTVDSVEGRYPGRPRPVGRRALQADLIAAAIVGASLLATSYAVSREQARSHSFKP